MTDESKPKIENLELNRETIQDLTEQESDQAEGGMMAGGAGRLPTVTCYSACFSCNPYTDCCLIKP